MSRREWLNNYYKKSSFWIKSILSLILVLDTLLMKIRPDYIPFNIISTIWIFDATILVFLLIIGTIPFIELFSKMRNKKGTKLALSDKNIRLAKTMGLDITHYYRATDFNNAAILGNDLYIDDKLEGLWTPDELSAIIAHEFSHKTNKNKHTRIFAFGGLTCGVFAFLLNWNLSIIFQLILVYAVVYLIFPYFAWLREFDCDENAVRYVKTTDLQNALRVFGGKNIHNYSFLHPSIWCRIQNLEKKRARYLVTPCP